MNCTFIFSVFSIYIDDRFSAVKECIATDSQAVHRPGFMPAQSVISYQYSTHLHAIEFIPLNQRFATCCDKNSSGRDSFKRIIFKRFGDRYSVTCKCVSCILIRSSYAPEKRKFLQSPWTAQ